MPGSSPAQDPARRSVATWMTHLARVAAGGVIGGAVGYFIFGWLVSHNLYGPPSIGLLVGVGAAVAAGPTRSMVGGVLAGLIALAAMTIAECAFLRKNFDIAQFVTQELFQSGITAAFFGIGVAVAFMMVGLGRTRPKSNL